MTTPREDELTERLNEFLDRFSPPRSIQNNPKAMQDDADAMLRTVLRFAPATGYRDWLEQMLERLAEGMTTRSWPAPGELVRACRAMSQGRGDTPDSMIESAAIERMIDWYGKFGDQLPGHGKPHRTAELIRRGVFANEREARFRGFDLGDDQRRRAMDQPMGADEWRHHVRVMARLKGISESEAEAQERAVFAKGGIAVGPVSIPDKRVTVPAGYGEW